MTQQTSTLADLQLQVAENFSVEKDCPEYPYLDNAYPEQQLSEDVIQRRDAECVTCNGTGKVTTYPMRVECPGHATNVSDRLICIMDSKHVSPTDEGIQCESCPCGGFGWVSNTDLATLMRETKVGYMNTDVDRGGWHIRFRDENGRLSFGVTVSADDPELALWQAMVQWQNVPAKAP